MKKTVVLVLLILWIISLPAFSEIEKTNAERILADQLVSLRYYLIQINGRLLKYRDEMGAYPTQLSQSDKDKLQLLKPYLTVMYNSGADAIGSIDTEWPDLN